MDLAIHVCHGLAPKLRPHDLQRPTTELRRECERGAVANHVERHLRAGPRAFEDIVNGERIGGGCGINGRDDISHAEACLLGRGAWPHNPDAAAVGRGLTGHVPEIPRPILLIMEAFVGQLDPLDGRTAARDGDKHLRRAGRVERAKCEPSPWCRGRRCGGPALFGRLRLCLSSCLHLGRQAGRSLGLGITVGLLGSHAALRNRRAADTATPAASGWRSRSPARWRKTGRSGVPRVAPGGKPSSIPLTGFSPYRPWVSRSPRKLSRSAMAWIFRRVVSNG